MMLLAGLISPDCNVESLIQTSKKMKRTVTEILIEVEETVALHLREQKSPAVENDIWETTGEQIICPFCERTFPTKTKNTTQKK